MRKEKVVIPGERLAIAEEFDAGENTFREGNEIFASVFGKAHYDKKSHTASVLAEKSAKPFEIGSKVYARVLAVRKSRVVVKLLYAFQGLEARVATQGYAILFISNVDNRFIKDLREEFRIGDIIVAEIADIKPYGVYLRTNKPSLGVIKAFCTKCRAELYLKDSKLMCKRCNNIERRKISAEYLLKL